LTADRDLGAGDRDDGAISFVVLDLNLEDQLNLSAPTSVLCWLHRMRGYALRTIFPLTVISVSSFLPLAHNPKLTRSA
jgi:hypothetical protein